MKNLGKAKIIKDQISIIDIIEYYGLKMNRSRFIVCPFHDDHSPSCIIYKETQTYKCFVCGAYGDVIDFVKDKEQISFNEAVDFIAKIFQLNIDFGEVAKPNDYLIKMEAKDKLEKQRWQELKKNRLEIKKYIDECHANVNETEYFKARGFTKETIKRFHLGYDKAKQCIIVPYNRRRWYYMARNIGDKVFYKPPQEIAGKEPLFNELAILQENEYVFVVESPLCAMSIMQCGFKAISICGLSKCTKLKNDFIIYFMECKLILSFDNDEVGQKMEKQIYEELQGCHGIKVGVNLFRYNISGNKKDPNELLIENPKLLKKNLEEAIKYCESEYMEE